MKISFKVIVIVILTLSIIMTACGAPAATETQPLASEIQPLAAATDSPTSEPSPSIPAEISGEVIYIPFPVEITVDGDLSDWAEIPVILVDLGPMLSTDPADNGSFTFAVAADLDNLYITMQMPDKNLITGKHGTEFWNEDSMEFYVNASGNLNATAYGLKMMQVNINASDIGNTDPKALTITGVFSSDAKVSGFVFKTPEGWAFEAALALKDLVEVTHGEEIGFQAQINGASKQDRDIKLIWSKADTSDLSWENPSLFGRALFYELGRSDIPQPSVVAALPEPTPTQGPEIIPSLVSVNQVGYFVNGLKIALVVDDAAESLPWVLKNADGDEVMSGNTLFKGMYSNSGDSLHEIDFSGYTTAGEGYFLEAAGMKSVPFNISDAIYSRLKHDALSYFYLNRSGITIEEEFAGKDWARPAGHITDANVTCYKGKDADGNDWPGCDYTLDVAGGWYDAGDFGKYVVNGGITAWTLMSLHEQGWEVFPDGSQMIPERSNGVSDLLDEARWEMEFLLSMQVPEGQPKAGMVHHKIHDESWAGMPMVPPTAVDNDNANAKPAQGRYLFAPSTAATLNLAATAAQCARIWSDLDQPFAERCLVAAESAWQAARQNPGIYAGNNPGSGGGNYEDENVSDEFYWAASELFITTGKEEYKSFLLASVDFAKADAFDWGHVAPLGTISLLTNENSLSAEQKTALEQAVIAFAERMIKVQERDGYAVLIDEDYPWGSNGLILNNMLLMSIAYNMSGDARYLDAVRLSMDYILGRNTLNKSFVAGYGTYPMLHPHHRFWANDPARGFPPPPPGALSGGPNFNPSDPPAETADLMSLPPSKRYVDDLESYSTNEVAINWNAPLVWVSTFLDHTGR
ncbi:MAG: glycoside hydrolase family 9 protein [Anaerolineaceae bacterium]